MVVSSFKTVKKEIKGARKLKRKLKRWIERDNSISYKWEKIDKNAIHINDINVN